VDASINGYRIYFQDKNYPDAIRNLENARKKLTGNDLLKSATSAGKKFSTSTSTA
jgi:hypothetical protein